MPLGIKVGLGQGDFVLDGNPAPLPKMGAEPPKFSAYVYCGQTAVWIKMVLGMEVGLSPCGFVLDGNPAHSQKGGRAPSPIFGPFLRWPNGWMDEDATWYGSRPRPRPRCIRRGPISPRKGHSSLALFSAHVYRGHGRPSQLLLSSCRSSCTDVF